MNRISRTTLILGLMSCLAIPALPEDFCSRSDALTKQPVLWEHDNFRGRCLRLKQELVSFGPAEFHDKASSVCVPAGLTLVLWEHSNFRGARFTIHGPTCIADLKRDLNSRGEPFDWGDVASSAQLKRQ